MSALEKALEQVTIAVAAIGNARSLCDVAYREDRVLAGAYSSRLGDAKRCIEVVERQLELAVERERSS